MKKYDVTALGELLIDFTMNGKSDQGNSLFEANPGGAPCNVLAILKKLGKETAFIGKVGQDQFGILLKDTLESIGIDTTNLIMDPEINTTLAFVHTMPDGDRDFSFYRKPGADMMLKEEEIQEELLQNTKIFHFGSLSMTDEGVRNATKKAIAIAKKSGTIISFDPNLRKPLWENLEAAKEQIIYGISQCDILKISDDELEFISDEKDLNKGVEFLKNNFDLKLIFITKGKNGSMVVWKQDLLEVEGIPQKNTIDTTGAGDTFCGCVLNYILEHGIDSLNKEKAKEMLTFANAAAALVTTKKGALLSMAEEEEVYKLIEEVLIEK